MWIIILIVTIILGVLAVFLHLKKDVRKVFVVKLKYRYPETNKTTISKFTIDYALTSDFGSKYSEVEEVDVSNYIDVTKNTTGL